MSDNMTSRIQEIVESEARARIAREEAKIIAGEKIYAKINIENGFQNGFDLIWRLEYKNVSLNWLFHIEADALVFRKFTVFSDMFDRRITSVDEMPSQERRVMEDFLSRPNLPQIINDAVVMCLDDMADRIRENRQLWADGLWPWASDEEATDDER